MPDVAIAEMGGGLATELMDRGVQTLDTGAGNSNQAGMAAAAFEAAIVELEVTLLPDDAAQAKQITGSTEATRAFSKEFEVEMSTVLGIAVRRVHVLHLRLAETPDPYRGMRGPQPEGEDESMDLLRSDADTSRAHGLIMYATLSPLPVIRTTLRVWRMLP